MIVTTKTASDKLTTIIIVINDSMVIGASFSFGLMLDEQCGTK